MAISSATTPSATRDIPVTATVTEVPPNERLAATHQIIKKNVYWSVGVGLVPIPVVDMVGVLAVQLRMIKELSDAYGVKFSEQIVKNLIGALIGTLGTRAISLSVAGSLMKTIPGLGGIVGGILCLPLVAGAMTYALGKVFVQHFETGGTLLDFDPEKMKAYFAAQYQEGKKVAAEAKRAT